MYKFFLFLIGVFLTSIGLFFLILYFNLFTLGYSFFDFVKFIIRKPECWLFTIGLILLYLSLGRRIKSELFLRRTNKYERGRNI